jgi:hypothetical protein
VLPKGFFGGMVVLIKGRKTATLGIGLWGYVVYQYFDDFHAIRK